MTVSWVVPLLVFIASFFAAHQTSTPFTSCARGSFQSVQWKVWNLFESRSWPLGKQTCSSFSCFRYSTMPRIMMARAVMLIAPSTEVTEYGVPPAHLLLDGNTNQNT